jgi:DNA-directed RNA polymerase sigma subunit (sigma70/sigma32)
VANQGRTVRLPAYLQDRLHKMQRVAQDLEQTLGRAPNEEELADILEITPNDVHAMRTAAVPVSSLDDPINEDDDESPVAQIEDSEVIPLDELVACRMLRGDGTRLGGITRAICDDLAHALWHGWRQAPHVGVHRPKVEPEP